MRCQMTCFSLILSFLFCSSPVLAQERITFLYPSAASSWAIPMVAKEAKYFEQEGLAVELVRVGGSTRIVAALIGGRWSARAIPSPRRWPTAAIR